MNDIAFETKIDFGNFGGNKKLTFTSWNGNAPRYDIRDWYDDKAGKGITLDKDELKRLYELLVDMYENNDEAEDEAEDETVEETESPWDMEETTTDTDEVEENTEEETEEEAEEETYPKAIQKKFDTLDKLFKGFKVEKTYGKMPFADGDRLQYCVHKSNKDFNIKEKELTTLGVKWFITDKGNLYIYTL